MSRFCKLSVEDLLGSKRAKGRDVYLYLSGKVVGLLSRCLQTRGGREVAKKSADKPFLFHSLRLDSARLVSRLVFRRVSLSPKSHLRANNGKWLLPILGCSCLAAITV